MKKFLVGMIIGAVVTAICTPKTGKGLQDELIQKTNDLRKKIKEFDIKDINYHDTKCALKEKLDDAKQMIEDFDWAESKEKVQKKFDEVTCRLGEIKEQLTEEKEAPVVVGGEEEDPAVEEQGETPFIEEEVPSVVNEELFVAAAEEEAFPVVEPVEEEEPPVVEEDEEEEELSAGEEPPPIEGVEAPFSVLNEAPFSPFSEEKEPPLSEVRESLFAEIKETPFVVRNED